MKYFLHTPSRYCFLLFYVKVFLEYFISIVLGGKIVIYLKISSFACYIKEKKKIAVWIMVELFTQFSIEYNPREEFLKV